MKIIRGNVHVEFDIKDVDSVTGIDHTGKHTGQLTVIRQIYAVEKAFVGKKPHILYWLCKCECGKLALRTSVQLRGNNQRYCSTHCPKSKTKRRRYLFFRSDTFSPSHD